MARVGGCTFGAPENAQQLAHRPSFSWNMPGLDKLVDHAKPDESKVSLGLTPSQMAERILQSFKPKLSTVNV